MGRQRRRCCGARRIRAISGGARSHVACPAREALKRAGEAPIRRIASPNCPFFVAGAERASRRRREARKPIGIRRAAVVNSVAGANACGGIIGCSNAVWVLSPAAAARGSSVAAVLRRLSCCISVVSGRRVGARRGLRRCDGVCRARGHVRPAIVRRPRGVVLVKLSSPFPSSAEALLPSSRLVPLLANRVRFRSA